MDKNSYMLNMDNITELKHGAVRRKAAENTNIIENEFKDSPDIVIRYAELQGRKCTLAYFDSLCDSFSAGETILRPLFNYKGNIPKENYINTITTQVVVNTDVKIEESLDEAIKLIMRGHIALFIDFEKECIAFGVQKIPYRAIEQADTEVQETGSREGFVENLKINIALVRKRMITTDMKIELLNIGKTSNTNAAIFYMSQKVEKSLVDEVKKRIKDAESDIILDPKYFRKCLDTEEKSIFSMVGDTERPDVLCTKINEGKVAVLVDGSPYALTVPHFFIENFQTLDDYLNRSYFASMMRILRMLCFIISITLPSLYVAVGLFHQELFPDYMLYSIVMSESNTMFPLMIEALVIIFIYEVVREAGLRMPKSVGQAVSLVGAIVIGDAAVTGGLIGAPMLIIVAITAISSFMVSSLYQPVSLLRFIFIIIGGTTGLYGIVIGIGVLIINMCSLDQYGSAYLAPLVPYNRTLFRDAFLRTPRALNSKYLFNVGKQKKNSKR